jgi:hypothetical protein
MNMSGDGNQLLQKLDEFIRKYYLNQLIRGALLSTGLLVAFFLAFAALEYYGRFGVTGRTIFFYSLLVVSAAALAQWVVNPLIHLWNIRPGISYDEAASIVGKHFNNIEDRLLNTLQLQRTAANSQSELLLASIDQRITELKPVPFATAIDLKENKQFLRYALPPLILLLLILAIAPSLVTEGTRRIVNHRTPFENLAPFLFNVQNNELSTIELQDFELVVSLDGKEVPNDLYVEVDGKRTLMNKLSAAEFSYVFHQPRENVNFRLNGNGYNSSDYELKVLPKPSVVGFDVSLEFPGYIGRPNENRQNSGDLLVPEGTRVNWNFNTSKTDKLSMVLGDETVELNRNGENNFSFSEQFRKSSEYTVIGSNEYLKAGDSLRYTVTVVPDLYPSISVAGVEDSLNPKRMYFNGQVKDDYGFSSLVFKYKRLNEDGSTSEENDVAIGISKNQKSETFFHFWDLAELGLEPGDAVEYFFEVWDNDGVNGSKSSRSESKTYRVATLNELAAENDAKSEQLKEELSETLKMAKEMQNDLEDLQKDLLNKKNLDWEDKEKMKQMLQTQKALQKKMDEIQQKSEQKNSKMNEMMEFDPNLVEKQKQLEELFEEVMSEDMKKLFEEMEKLMDEMTKEKAQELLEDIEMSNEDLEKELDRSLELFKQLEFEQKLEQTMERLEELAKDQEELAKETKDKSSDNEELSEKQEQLNEEFEDIKKEMDDLEKKNEELENPNQMEDFSNEEESVSESQKDSKQQLDQNQNKKASESQQKASDQMKNMAQKMGNMMMQMQAQGQQEDMEALRQIVENLLTLSFDQENLIGNLKETNQNDPKYTELAREQLKLKDDSMLIEDSLYALSKRVPQIETVINREIRSVNSNMKKSIAKMADRKTPEALSRQQFALTSLNNLALLLSETVQQMQAAAAQAAGSGSCSKPGGGGKPSAGAMRKLQEQMNKQLEEMRKGMQPGGKKKGEKPGGMSPGNRGMSKQLAQMAAKQEALRQMAREYESQLQKEGETGKGGAGEMKKLQELMEQTETDLVNKMITQETLMRQQEILTKLLEAETAEREREQEQRRESKEAKNEDYGNPEIFFEYIRQKNNETELLRTVPPNLNPFYRDKVDEYFKKQVE